MNKQKVALIGIGHVSQHQLEAFRRYDGLELAAVCDIDPRRSLPEYFSHLPQYKDVGELLRCEEDIRVVFISVPNNAHYKVASQAIKAGRHVLVEKPATKTLEEFDLLCEAADRKGVMMYSSTHAAFGREVVWFREEYLHEHSGVLGPLTGFSVGLFDPCMGPDSSTPVKETLDDSWTDSGVNALSVICQFTPNLQFQHGTLVYAPINGVEGLHATMHFKFGNGFYGDVSTGWASGLNEKTTRLEYGEGRTAILLDHSNQRVTRPVGGSKQEVLQELGDIPRLTAHFMGVFSDFVSYLNREKEDKDNRKFSRRCLELLVTARKNARMYGRDPDSLPSPSRPYAMG